MDLGLENKTVIITGGANGIGAETAQRMFDEGARIVIADIDADRAGQRAAEIGQATGRAIGVAVDVIDAGSVEHLIAKTVAAFGSVHVLVNNAGFTRDMRITKMSEDDWDAVVDVVLKGAFFCTKAVVPHFHGQNWGRIINISSRAHLGNSGQANYSAAKAGLIGFTKAMALEHGRYNVTANAVAPGIIDTEMVRRLPHFDKIRATAEGSLPIRRLGTARDVADAILFLASDRASYISGEVIHVTGGRYG